MTPNSEQQSAIEQMLAHLRATGDAPFFKLEGPAGTGKTFCTVHVMQAYKRRVIVTAPTNKAVRVIREALAKAELRLECRTIYSLLGLKLEPNGEVKELAKPEDPVDLGDVAAVVVDEAFMLNQQVWGYIQEAQSRHPRLRWIFMGDPYQLPPVGERDSPVQHVEKGARLSVVMRQDNQILKLVTHLRGMVEKPFAKLQLLSDNDGEEGVWTCEGGGLDQAILNQAKSFLSGESKAIAWRNATVDKLNAMVRQELFSDVIAFPWQPSDRITLLEPAKDLEGEVIGTTDEDGSVERADLVPHPIHGDIECWRIVMRSDMNASLTLWALSQSPATQRTYNLRLARLAAEAKAVRSKWKDYWTFRDAFHKVRHSYAITAHRAQGSTYQRAFVNWRDILANPDRGEAMRCLYVAASRPKKELYLG